MGDKKISWNLGTLKTRRKDNIKTDIKERGNEDGCKGFRNVYSDGV